MPDYTNRLDTQEQFSSTVDLNGFSSGSSAPNSPELRRRSIDDQEQSNDSAPIRRALPYLNNNSNFIHGNSIEPGVDLLPLSSPSIGLSSAPYIPLRRRRVSPWVTTYWNSPSSLPAQITNIRGSGSVHFQSHEINRISARSLLEDMPSVSTKDNNIFCEHCNHHPMDYSSSFPMDKGFDKFLELRKMNGIHYNKLRNNNNSGKKRKFCEIEDNYHVDKFKFENIRPQKNSFFKNGVKFEESIKHSYSISFLNLDFNNMTMNGYLSFKSNEQKVEWFNEIIPNKYLENTKELSSLPFTGEIIDFENFDLRYKTSLQQNFEITMQQTGEVRSHDFYSVYQNCITRKQLARWMTLKPFKNMTIKKMQYFLTCESCLESLQNKHILLKLFLKNSSIPDLLVCIDKEQGIVEMTSSESRNNAITEHMLYERELAHYEKNDKLIIMSANPMIYSSSSIGLS